MPFYPGQLAGLVLFLLPVRIRGRLPAVPDLRQALSNYARASRINGLLCSAGSGFLIRFCPLAGFQGLPCFYPLGRICGSSRLPDPLLSSGHRINSFFIFSNRCIIANRLTYLSIFQKIIIFSLNIIYVLTRC